MQTIASQPALQARISKHAEVRLQQRGFTKKDLHIIRTHGEPVNDGYVVSDKALQRLKQDLQRLERLRGAAVIEQEGVIATAYRTDKATFRRLRSRTKRSRV